MTMEMTARWELPLLHAGQAQKELFHNEALTLIDMLVHGVARSADVAVPPDAPVAGSCWIVAAGASGAWAGQAGAVALWTAGGWRFVAPRQGLALFVADRGHALVHDGSGWQDAALRGDGLYLGGVQVVGEQLGAIAAPSGGATVDAEARATIGSILSALRSHGLIES